MTIRQVKQLSPTVIPLRKLFTDDTEQKTHIIQKTDDVNKGAMWYYV